jgi:hypothetical protein
MVPSGDPVISPGLFFRPAVAVPFCDFFKTGIFLVNRRVYPQAFNFLHIVTATHLRHYHKNLQITFRRRADLINVARGKFFLILVLAEYHRVYLWIGPDRPDHTVFSRAKFYSVDRDSAFCKYTPKFFCYRIAIPAHFRCDQKV